MLSSVIYTGLSIWIRIVQGSGNGPTLHIIAKNDLCSISAINDIFKYADDTTLLVPQHTDVELDVESQNVKARAATNCFTLNLSKTKEIVFKRPRVQYFHMPPALDDIEQLDCCKLLGCNLSIYF